jgi:hypothetical protein
MFIIEQLNKHTYTDAYVFFKVVLGSGYVLLPLNFLNINGVAVAKLLNCIFEPEKRVLFRLISAREHSD